MRWILIVLLMCNGIYFLWQNYLLQNEEPVVVAIDKVEASGGQRLVLLSELPPQSRAVAEKVSPEPIADRVKASEAENESNAEIVESTSQSKPEKPPVCWLIGPFKEPVSAKQVVSRLAALDISLQLKQIEIPGKPDYWVHIPPKGSRKEALKLLRELQSNKVDSFLITEGELANGISLGFFTEEPRAKKVYERRKKQGYEAVIKKVPRTRTELWALFEQGEYEKFSDALWDKTREGNKGLERRKNFCDKIASADNFD